MAHYLISATLLAIGTSSVRSHEMNFPGILNLGGNMRAQATAPNKIALSSLVKGDYCKNDLISSSLSPSAVNNHESVQFAFDSSEFKYVMKSNDWLGFYCGDDLSLVKDTDYLDWRYITPTEIENGGGSDIFDVNSGRSSYCEYRFFNHDNHTPYCKIGTSSSVNIKDAKSQIQHLHIALTDVNSEMRIMWTSSMDTMPSVTYSSNEDLSDSTTLSGVCHTYKQSDMCESPAITEAGFVEPGFLCEAIMTNLQPDTNYNYKVTCDDSNYSRVASFKSAPPLDDKDYSFSYLVYGDMGTWSGDASAATVKISTHHVENENVRRVDHIGDISYARGTSSIWDVWFSMIDGYSAAVPYMIGLGNHEYDYSSGGENDPSGVDKMFSPSWWNGGSDSGGECGVPLHHRFTMPNSDGSNGIFWYDYKYANTHTIMLSSEHDCSVGSPQYDFLKGALENIDREAQPWVVVEFHRPMYNNEKYLSDYNVAVGMQGEFEELLVEHEVDLVLAGHYHSYLRTSRIYKDKRDEEKGIYHYTIGSAGASLDIVDLYDKDWVENFTTEFGIGKITVMNSTHMLWEYIENKENDGKGAITDSAWIIKKSVGSSGVLAGAISGAAKLLSSAIAKK